MGLNLNPFGESKKEKTDEFKTVQREQNVVKTSDSEPNLDYMDIDTLMNLAEEN